MNTSQVMLKAALLSMLLASPLVSRSHAAAIGIDPRSAVTATMDGGTAKTGNTWYEKGVNTASNTTGLVTGVVSGQSDPLSSYLIQPAQGNNVLLLDTANKTGTLTLSRPISITALSLAGASGNGSGTNSLTLHFSDGSSTTIGGAVVGDWFNNTNRVQTPNGRIDAVANSFANVGSDNPRILAINETLSTADSAKFVTSIDLSWTGGSTTQTAIFGLSGDVTGIGHFTAIPLASSSFNQDVIVGIREVPEPGTIALIGIGAAGLMVSLRRKRS